MILVNVANPGNPKLYVNVDQIVTVFEIPKERDGDIDRTGIEFNGEENVIRITAPIENVIGRLASSVKVVHS